MVNDPKDGCLNTEIRRARLPERNSCASAKAINPTVFMWRDPAIPSSVNGKTRKAFKNQMAVPYATPLKKGRPGSFGSSTRA